MSQVGQSEHDPCITVLTHILHALLYERSLASQVSLLDTRQATCFESGLRQACRQQSESQRMFSHILSKQGRSPATSETVPNDIQPENCFLLRTLG